MRFFHLNPCRDVLAVPGFSHSGLWLGLCCDFGIFGKIVRNDIGAMKDTQWLLVGDWEVGNGCFSHGSNQVFMLHFHDGFSYSLLHLVSCVCEVWTLNIACLIGLNTCIHKKNCLCRCLHLHISTEDDGRVICWGSSFGGGAGCRSQQHLREVQQIQATRILGGSLNHFVLPILDISFQSMNLLACTIFCALNKFCFQYCSWIVLYWAATVFSVLVETTTSSHPQGQAFAAIRRDGSVVLWGNEDYGASADMEEVLAQEKISA